MPPFPTAQHLRREHFRTMVAFSSVMKTEEIIIVLLRNIAGTHERAHTPCVSCPQCAVDKPDI